MKRTKVSLDCMEQCPCYSQCETCKNCESDFGQDFCPDEITDIEKYLAVWGEEEAECMLACDQPRKDCYDACDTATCKDECDTSWIEREICCHRECPCHSKCPNGCPCFGDSDCGEPDVNGHDYCPTTWTMISLTVSKTTVMYHVNAFNHVSMTLTNALLTVPVMPPVFKLVRIMKNSANQIVHAMKNVPMVAHALDGAVNFHVTQFGLISEIVAKTNVWSSGITAKHHVVMDKIFKSA